jgi:flagellar M-ring protein FliF
MNFLQRITAIWQKVSLVQRALLVAVCLASLIVGALLIHWARQPDMRMLYQGLPAAEAGKIVEKIAEKDIAYELRERGGTIYVPAENVYQLRLDMAKEGLPVGQQTGYKLFDDEKIGVSPFVQNVNLKRALQDELAKSVQMIEGVLHARVHIVDTQRSLFTAGSGGTTASVVLRLRPGYRISPLNIAAITHLVAGSVKGLESGNVTVIDSQGRLLSNESDQKLVPGAGTVQDYKERVEQNLAKKVEDMLTTVLGPGRATVGVNAVIDMNSVSTVTETYDPTAKVIKKEEIKTNEEGPVQASGQGQETVSGSKKKDEEILTEYEIGKTVKQQVVLPGAIQSLSVAAFVDLSAPEANDPGQQGQSAMIMELSEVEEIIKNALGLTNADLLKVVHAKFHRPAPLLAEDETAFWSRYLPIIRQASLGIMALCALLVFRIFVKAKKKVAVTAESKQLPETGGAVGFLPGSQQAPEPLMIRKQIASALQNNPEQVKQLFASWLEEKE